MAMLKLIQFSGEIPRLLKRLLPDTGAQRAENVRLDDGGLTPVRGLRFEANIAVDNAKTIYKHGLDWLAWDTVVHAAPGPVDSNRLYYTGDGTPKMLVGGVEYELAVPFPATALTATLAGTATGTDITTRVYVYTYVTDFGEESEPCPVSNEVDWKEGNTVTLSGFAAAPAGRNITKQRIYRSQSSSSSGTGFFLIAERAESASDFSDTVPPEGFMEGLPSIDYNAPPSDLHSLTVLPNGMMAGLSGKELCFSEPWQPHAWPEKYRMTLDYVGVGLGAFSTTVAVMTDGTPYIAQGTHPEVMQLEKQELNAPCINARGIVDLGYAVAYPSHDGLIVVAPGGAEIASETLMTRTKWLKTNPSTYVSGQYAGRYFASYAFSEPDGEEFTGTLIYDIRGQLPFIIRGAPRADAFHYDLKASALYFLLGKEIYEWDAPGKPNETMEWRSKEFVVPAKTSYGCILIEQADMTPEQVKALEDEIAAIQAQNAVIFAQDSIGGEINGGPINAYPINGDQLLPIPAPAGWALVQVFADGELVAAVDKVGRIVRLPPKSADKWEVQVNGTMPLAQITLATSPRELVGK